MAGKLTCDGPEFARAYARFCTKPVSSRVKHFGAYLARLYLKTGVSFPQLYNKNLTTKQVYDLAKHELSPIKES